MIFQHGPPVFNRIFSGQRCHAETAAFFNAVAIGCDNNIVQYWLYFSGTIFCKKKMAVFKMKNGKIKCMRQKKNIASLYFNWLLHIG